MISLKYYYVLFVSKAFLTLLFVALSSNKTKQNCSTIARMDVATSWTEGAIWGSPAGLYLFTRTFHTLNSTWQSEWCCLLISASRIRKLAVAFHSPHLVSQPRGRNNSNRKCYRNNDSDVFGGSCWTPCRNFYSWKLLYLESKILLRCHYWTPNRSFHRYSDVKPFPSNRKSAAYWRLVEHPALRGFVDLLPIVCVASWVQFWFDRVAEI